MSKRELDEGFTESIDYHGDDIVCPHCLEIDYEHADYPRALRHDGDEATHECSECGRTFKVSMCVEYTFRSYK